MPITKVFSSHPTKFTQEGLKMPTPFPFKDYGRALTDISQCIFTQRGNNSGVKCSRNWLLNRGTLRLFHLPGEQWWCPAPLPLQPHATLSQLAGTQRGENTTALTGAEILQGPAGEARNLEKRRKRDVVQWVGCRQQQESVGVAQPCRGGWGSTLRQGYGR